MTKRSLEDAVALLDLPSWEHVGAELLSHGITDGEQESCERCPIAQFLTQSIAARRSVAVTTSYAYRRPFSPRGVPLPPAAEDFIRWFDDIGRP